MMDLNFWAGFRVGILLVLPFWLIVGLVIWWATS